MKVEKRQDNIITMLKNSDTPLSGTQLASKFNVSRQIIVQDMNKLRSDGYEIVSTPRGYLLDKKYEVTRVFKLFHTKDDTEKELNLIVDLGASIKDVFIFHKVYGEIRAMLYIRSRKEARDFCNSIESGCSFPLMTATGGYHYHTIVADSEEILDLVEKELADNNFLAPLTDYEPDSLIR